MSRNTEATDDVKTWTGGPLNYKEGFFTRCRPMSWRKASMKRWCGRFPPAAMSRVDAGVSPECVSAWLEMEEPHWLKAHYDKLNYQDYSYYSAPSCGNCDDTCASEPGAVQQTGASLSDQRSRRGL
jgi:Fe-S cluster assembly protein SufB